MKGVAVMATAKQNLNRQLGADNANAIEALVTEALREHGESLENLRQEVAGLREEVSEFPELRARLNAAARALLGEINDHNDRVERHNDGQSVTPDEVAAEGQRLDEVQGQVGEVRDALEERVGVLEAILASDHDGERPASRIDGIEDDIVGLRGRLDQVESRAGEAHSLSTQAIAIARASIMGGNLLRRAATAALATWLVVFAIYFLLAGLGPVDWKWRDAFGWPSVLAGLVGCLVYLFARQREEAQAGAAAVAQAQGNGTASEGQGDTDEPAQPVPPVVPARPRPHRAPAQPVPPAAAVRPRPHQAPASASAQAAAEASAR